MRSRPQSDTGKTRVYNFYKAMTRTAMSLLGCPLSVRL